ncbi:MAG: dTDP-4-amino-4,6-dideoxygalactose transaminase [Thermoleophilia bacterium]|nr:dTDP-4-amino-4,6-dideoxygalactose transaminase [Thermoleophilia bacterium]
MERFHLDIPFNRPYATGREFEYIAEAIERLQLSGNGPFGRRCEDWLARTMGAHRALLTPSATAGLELAALLAEIRDGDEVIMPSFTFSSTATAFVLRGAVPVFVDVREDTLNIDEEVVEAAVTDRTRAIVPVHYAGVAAELDPLLELAKRRGLTLIEDAAQAIGSTYRGRPVGSDCELSAVSFHETKNVMCGEGGALLVNAPELVERAEIIREKGTDRAQLFRGEVDKYSWRDIGSSFLLSEINAAFLWAQLEAEEEIRRGRLELWNAYHDAFDELEFDGLVRRPVVPEHCTHNAHLYYLLLPDEAARDRLIERLRLESIAAIFHYVPLHSSEAGRRYGRAHGDLSRTDSVSGRVLRLPLWIGMGPAEIERVVDAVDRSLRAEHSLQPARRS